MSCLNISLSATLAMFCLAASGSASDPTIRTVAGLAAYRNGPPSAERPYDIEGQVTLVKATHLWVQDKTGITSMANTFKTPPVVGDIVHISGVAKFNDCGNVTTRHRSHGRVVGHADPPAPRRIAIADAERPENDMRLVEVEGVVADCFPDEIDSKTDLLVIRDGAATLPIAIARGHIPNMSDIIDARIRATGFASRSPIGQRRTQGAMLIAMGEGSIGIVKPPPADRFAYPPFSYYPSRTPAELAALGRHTVSGLVVAAWKDSRLMLMTDRLHVSAVELVRGVAPPRCGSWIQVAGYPASDLYTVNFTRCFFRQIPGASGENAPEKASLPKLAAKGYSSTQIAPLVAGKEVTLRGPLCRDGADTAPQGHFSVDCCGFHVPVDVGLSGIDPEDVLPGSTVKATGIGVLDCDNWRPDMTFPRLRGFFVVMRSPEDLRILAPPPWWTKGRLLALVVGLTLMLAAITALACWLRSLVAKKSRELFDEQIERTSSELRIDERTRLAVELHDTLSQNLEGVACQVAATRAIMGDAAPEARECLFAAERMLESSRKEMRRVLFDLRSDALAERAPPLQYASTSTGRYSPIRPRTL